jgi:hypothetical protein
MFIAIVQANEVENEINIEWCCRDCTMKAYGWNDKQYDFVHALVTNSKPVPVTAEVDKTADFGSFIKNTVL